MATFNAIIQQRRSAIRQLKKYLREADSALEVIERKQNAMISRTNKVPEAYELAALAEAGRTLMKKVEIWTQQLGQAQQFFGAA